MAKKKWMQKAARRMKKKGTVGTFTAYCKRKGFTGVTNECIAMGLKSNSAKIRKRAAFAKTARAVAKRKKK